jgi:hypothetical protein
MSEHQHDRLNAERSAFVVANQIDEELSDYPEELAVFHVSSTTRVDATS